MKLGAQRENCDRHRRGHRGRPSEKLTFGVGIVVLAPPSAFTACCRLLLLLPSPADGQHSNSLPALTTVLTPIVAENEWSRWSFLRFFLETKKYNVRSFSII